MVKHELPGILTFTTDQTFHVHFGLFHAPKIQFQNWGLRSTKPPNRTFLYDWNQWKYVFLDLKSFIRQHQYTKNHLNSTKCWLSMQISDQATWFPVCPLSRPRPTPVRWGLLRGFRAQQLVVNQQPSEPCEKLNDVILLGFRGDC